MKEVEVSEVQIIPVNPQNGLVAFSSCVVNNQLYLGNIAIYTSLSSSDGFRLVYPAKILPTGKQINCVYPINKETGKAINKAIIGKFAELLSKVEID